MIILHDYLESEMLFRIEYIGLQWPPLSLGLTLMLTLLTLPGLGLGSGLG